MTRIFATLTLLIAVSHAQVAPSGLDAGWSQPPLQARVRAYWWWLNGNVTKESITRDLEGMKAKGFAGAVLFDANGASQEGNATVPHGPTFFTPAWRELYKHTLREADRLGLEISLNIQSGWNLGGPMVQAEDAPKKLVSTETRVKGGAPVSSKLPAPKARNGYYRDLFVVAYPAHAVAPDRKPIRNFPEKSLQKGLMPFSAPKSTQLFEEFPATPGEEDAKTDDVIDLTAKFDPKSGTLQWNAPPGEWVVLRFGCTLNEHCMVSTCSEGWAGYALDPFDAGAFNRYWDAVVEPLLADAGPLAGKSLKYLHTDSWEVEVANWTPTLREEFLKRRGYDLLKWLPVVEGRIINSRGQSNRFLADYRKTMGDLAIDNHYRIFRDRAHRHNVQIHPESGGPHSVPIDAQRCLGWDDAPMSEFWAWSWTHRIGDDNRFFVKQPASAAHTYGHPLVLAEGFTTIGPHWQETLWDNLKPSFDKALCEGLNVLVWHAFVCSPDSTGIPGQQYFAGTHLNPKVTWWSRSAPVFSYFDRCQYLLQQGLFVADVVQYYGDHVPNFTQHKRTDPTHIQPGYDYDVITEEAVLTRTSVKNGRIVLPDGMSYRVLVLPERPILSLPVLRKLKELVADGATVIGPRPVESGSLQNYPACDREVAQIAGELWGGKTGKGRVIAGKSAREVLMADGVPPDCEFSEPSPKVELDFIHRAADGVEIYFVANRTNVAASTRGTFRVSGKVPELWDALDGGRRYASAYSESGGRTTVPLELPPCGSIFVVFHDPAAAHPATAPGNSPTYTPVMDISGPWSVSFDPKWGGPASATFDSLVSWTTRDEPGIKFYSGTATYHKSFDAPAGAAGKRLVIDLGNVKELAEVRLNGKSLGIVWTPPFRVDLAGALKPRGNALEVDVVNFWPNRIIGDASLPENKRLTRTNVRKLTAKTALVESGLLGPVRLLEVGGPGGH